MNLGKRFLTSFFMLCLSLFLLSLSVPVHAQVCTDTDGDGYGLNGDASCPNVGVDCNDTDDTIHPDAPLLCDAKDNNCDGWLDFSTDKDVDEDGVPLCTHWQTGLKDCDDNNANRFPGNIEVFGDPSCTDGIDNDCNNKTDGQDPKCLDQCNDSDGDLYGNPGHPSCANGGATDCDDNNAAINPGASDTVCDGVDDNCSGTADEEYTPTPTNCGVGACAGTGTLTCSGGAEVDDCTPGLPAKEGALGHPTCTDTVDNDCDTLTDASDPGCQSSCLDDDGDGYGHYGDASCPNGPVVDCDDDDPNINPGIPDDNCDGVDDNCSGTADDEYTPTVTNCGVGECETTGFMNCNAGVLEDDCSPLTPGTEGPFGDLTCEDTLDNDCDGDIDSGDNDCNPLDQDNDGDGYCEVGPCQNPANLDGDCDDTDLNTYPGAPQLCDAIDNDCDGWLDFSTDKDVDGDGVTLCTHWQTGLKDCDDNNANRFPGNIEVFGDPSCIDGIDNDCNNKIDSDDPKCLDQCNDSDGDGYGSPGHPSCPNPEEDCNDSNNLVNPGAADNDCDGVDENCSGTADEGYAETTTSCGVGACGRTGTLSCIGGEEVDDCSPGLPVKEGALGHPTCTDTEDNDCDTFTDASDPGCQTPCLDDDGDGYGHYGDASCPNAGVDCNDDNAAINPGAADDVCDGVDDNCSGSADDEYTPTVTNCGVGECATTGFMNCNAGVLEDDCSPLTPGTEGPFGDLTCEDTLDNDCDGDTDSGDNDCNPLDQDNDGDGYCEVGPCQNPANLDGDCDDTDPIVNPGGSTTICDAIDTNCDGWIDFATDKDVDGDGVPLCTHWQTGLNDCDDNDPNRYPGNQEGPINDPTCLDGIDNDCNNNIDDQDLKCLDQCNDSDGDGYGIPGHPSCTFPEEDCNDSNNLINPGAADNDCDGVDENCSGTADEGYVETTTSCGVGACGRTGTLSCIGGEEVDDCSPGLPVKEGALGHPTCTDTEDNDCDTFTDASDPGCQTPCLDDDGDGYGHYGDASCTNAGVDCDDDNAVINPGAADDVCDGVDDNCSGTADDEYTPTVTSCGVGECETTGFMNCNAGVLEDDCSPLTPGTEGPFGDLTCGDTLDNDCDGDIDTGDNDCNPLDQDNDGDGYCEIGPCQNPANLTGDCNDTDVNTYPGAPLLCDARDNNCDGWIDFSTDKDVDEDGVPLCTHWQTGLNDCDDNDPNRYPGNPEGPRDDPTCFDGIDNDCDNKTDNLDSNCAPPTCGTDPSPQDGPHMFDLLDGGDNVLKTPCKWCHFDNSQTVDERMKCERCHADPAWGGPDDGTLKVLYPDPPPYGFGTATNVRMHSSTVVGTKYGAWDMDCVTCHNPHRQEQDNTYGTSYGKLIKEFICFDNPVTGLNTEEIIEFTAATGSGSFADGPPHNENVCEMCHTQTKFHRNDGTTATHNDDSKCTDCHLHSDGFLPVAKSPHNTSFFNNNCQLCHVETGGVLDLSAEIPDANCQRCHGERTSHTSDLTRNKFASGNYVYDFTCVDCHDPMTAVGNNRKLLRELISASVIPGSVVLNTTRIGIASLADGPPRNENICETCHFLTSHNRGDGTGDGVHDDGINYDGSYCMLCHDHNRSFMIPGPSAEE